VTPFGPRPRVTHRRAIALAALLVLTACSQSGGGGDDASGRPPGTRWTQSFCGLYDEWVTSIVRRLATAQLLDPAIGPAAAHTALTDVAIGARDDTATLVGAIDASGEPAVPDGAVIAVDILGAFRNAENAFSSALSSLQAVNPNDPALLIPGADGVRVALVNTLASVRNELAAALSTPSAARLTPAFAAAPACDELFTPPEAPETTTTTVAA
jgi:hypothetical protein